MLSGLEAKLVAVVADAVAGRAGLSAVGATDPMDPEPKEGVVRGRLTGLTPDPGFSPGEVLTLNGGAPRRLRVLPVRFTATLEFSRRAAATDLDDEAEAEAERAARRALLEDLTVVAHALADPAVRGGVAFSTGAADPGFEVRGLELEEAAPGAEAAGGLHTGVLRYGGLALVWPPGTAEDAGVVVRAVDVLVESLPLTLSVEPAVVAVGGTGVVRVRGVSGRRLDDPATGQRAQLRLAVGVASDLPPAERGTIDGGAASPVAGFRVLELVEPETTAVYRAPTGDVGAVAAEAVVVHLATPAGTPGVALGRVAVALAKEDG